jgi:hypothetical protein
MEQELNMGDNTDNNFKENKENISTCVSVKLIKFLTITALTTVLEMFLQIGFMFFK